MSLELSDSRVLYGVSIIEMMSLAHIPHQAIPAASAQTQNACDISSRKVYQARTTHLQPSCNTTHNASCYTVRQVGRPPSTKGGNGQSITVPLLIVHIPGLFFLDFGSSTGRQEAPHHRETSATNMGNRSTAGPGRSIHEDAGN